MFVTDLHEDISYAIRFGGFDPVANRDLAVNFDRDLPGRHGDIPKYRRAGVKLVFGAIFPGREFWSPVILERLERLYGSWHGSSVLFIATISFHETLTIVSTLEPLVPMIMISGRDITRGACPISIHLLACWTSIACMPGIFPCFSQALRTSFNASTNLGLP